MTTERGQYIFSSPVMIYFQHYFVVSPKDVVVGKPRDEDDHIDWLLEQGSFETSLDFAEDKARLLRRHNVLKVFYVLLIYFVNKSYRN